MSINLSGLIGIVLVYVSVVIPSPYVQILDQHGVNAGQNCVARGLLALAVLLPFWWRQIAARPNPLLVWMGLVIGLVAFGLTKAFTVWGPALTMSVTACMPACSFLIALVRKRPVSKMEWLCAAIAVGGVLLTIQPWHDWVHFNFTGLGWSLGATILNAFLIELFCETAAEPLPRKIAWQALGLLGVGLIASTGSDWSACVAPHNTGDLLLVAGLLGIINFWANGMATSSVSPTTFSMMIVGLVPATIIFSNWKLGQSLDPSQWLGVAITFAGLLLLSLVPKKIC